MLAYHVVALSGSQQYAATTARGRAIVAWTATSTVAMAELSRELIGFVAKFLYSAAMSLDGFIPGPDADISWMAAYLGPNPVVGELIPQTGAIPAGPACLMASTRTRFPATRCTSSPMGKLSRKRTVR